MNEPEVARLQRPRPMGELARGRRAEPAPSHGHHPGGEHGERKRGDEHLSRLVHAGEGHKRRDGDDQLAVAEHRRARKPAGLRQPREQHDDDGAGGDDGANRLDREPPEQRVSSGDDSGEHDAGHDGQDDVTAGRGDASLREAGVGLDREHDEQAEDEHDGDVRQAERAERAQRVPGDREAPEHPAAQRGRAVPRRMYRDRGPDGHQPLLPVPAGNTGWTSAGSALTTTVLGDPVEHPAPVRRERARDLRREHRARGGDRVPGAVDRENPVAGGRQVAVPVDVAPVGERDGEAAGHRSRDDGGGVAPPGSAADVLQPGRVPVPAPGQVQHQRVQRALVEPAYRIGERRASGVCHRLRRRQRCTPVLLDQRPRAAGCAGLIAPDDRGRVACIPGQPDPHRWVARRFEHEPVGVDPAAQHLGVAVAVGDGSPVLAQGGVPSGNPVQLPGQDVRAVEQVLLLTVIADHPAAILDRGVRSAALGGHRRSARAHTSRGDRAGPGDVAVEAQQRRHLGAGRDGPRHGVKGGQHGRLLGQMPPACARGAVATAVEGPASAERPGPRRRGVGP